MLTLKHNFDNLNTQKLKKVNQKVKIWTKIDAKKPKW